MMENDRYCIDILLIKSKSVAEGCNYEVTYEVHVKDTDMNFISRTSKMTGVKSAIILSYDGDFTA